MTRIDHDHPLALLYRPGQPDQVFVLEVTRSADNYDDRVWIIETPVEDGDKLQIQPSPTPPFRYRFYDSNGRLLMDWDPARPEAATDTVNTASEPVRNPDTVDDAWPGQAPRPTTQTLREYLDGENADSVVLWWLQQAFEEAQATVQKAREYGSDELIYAGRVMSQIHSKHGPANDLSDAQAAEIQIFHYVLGKMGRWVAAMRRGEYVSDDTLLDIGVYVRMVQRMRETGMWP